MRQGPRDESGVEQTPPRVEPQLDRRVLGKCTLALVAQRRSYELITPLFGGGVEPGMADPVTVIRGPEVRGQLRFWWRACRGGGFAGSLQKMKDREDQLWGAASTDKKKRPSRVEVVVVTEQAGEEKRPFEVVAGPVDERTGRPRPRLRHDRTVVPAYAAFPLQPTDEEMRAGGPGMPTKPVRIGVRFTLHLVFPEEAREEVEAALWAWETFGGIGARTRRGFGALKLVAVNGTPASPPPAQEVEAWLHAGLRRHVVAGVWPAGVPHLSPDLRLKVTRPYGDPKVAWEYLIDSLRRFRQSRPGGSTKQPGRSRWPEPDQIRRLLNTACPRHATPVSTVGKFPRAAIGLPIVFHFKDESSGDPSKTTLQGRERDHDRLASPLLLRPLACANDQAVGLAAILEGTGVGELPGGLILKGAPEDFPVEAVLEPGEARKIEPLRGETDVLQAFLNTL